MARRLLIGALALVIGARVARAQGSSQTGQMAPPPRAEAAKDRAATAQAEGVYDQRKKLNPSLKLAAGVSGSRSVVQPQPGPTKESHDESTQDANPS